MLTSSKCLHRQQGSWHNSTILLIARFAVLYVAHNDALENGLYLDSMVPVCFFKKGASDWPIANSERHALVSCQEGEDRIGDSSVWPSRDSEALFVTICFEHCICHLTQLLGDCRSKFSTLGIVVLEVSFPPLQRGGVCLFRPLPSERQKGSKELSLVLGSPEDLLSDLADLLCWGKDLAVGHCAGIEWIVTGDEADRSNVAEYESLPRLISLTSQYPE